MNVNKVKVVVVAGILILFMLGGYFIWVAFFKPAGPKPQQAAVQPTVPVVETQGFKPIGANEASSLPVIRIPEFKPVRTSEAPSSFEESIYESGAETSSAGEKLNVPTLPIPKPDLTALFKEKSLPTSTIPFFENIRKAAEIAEEKVMQRQIVAPTQTAPLALSATNVPGITSTEILLSLTNDEFHFFYPDVFIASLMDAQNLLKEYDPSYVPLPKIETDSQVRFVEEKIVAALFSANMLTKEEAERAITTIRFTLPQLQLTELKKQKTTSLNESSQRNMCFLQPSIKGLFFAGLMERLYSAFIPKAQAKGPCGYCYTQPECYQVGASAPTPGLNVWKAFCYCTGCLYGQGCLDFCTGQSAIWDPMTGICGCG